MIFYHNLTKNWFNETDLEDAVYNSSMGDVIKFTFSGSAMIYDLKDDREYPSIRTEFLDLFEEVNEIKFLLTMN